VDLPHIESICLQVSNSNLSFTLGCIYRPPNTVITDDVILTQKLQSLSANCSNLMIAGDFNFPQLTWPIKQQSENTSSNSLFADLIMNSNLQQLILEPTRYRCGQRPSLLDLLLCNENNLIYDTSLTSPIGKSDHVVIEYKLQLLIDNKPKQFLKHLNIINYTNLKERLNSTDWSLVFDSDDSTSS
jgi:hypothetical protein